MKKACLFISILFFGVPLAHAQASVSLSPVARQFFLNEITGLPLSGGKLCTYQAGTTTPQATYVDSTGVSQNTNPIILDSEGQANVWLVNGEKYKFVLYDNAGTPNTCTGNLQWTVDNISAAGGGNVTGCAVTGPLNSVLFINPLGACDGVSKFTTNENGQVNINHAGTLEIDSVTDPANNFSFNQGHQWYIKSTSANWDGSTNDGYTAYVDDSEVPPQTSGALSGTNVTVASGILTVAATGAATLFPLPGYYAYFTGCTAATQLNGNIYQVANADTTQLIAVHTGLDDYSSAADSCTVEWQKSSSPIPFYSSGGVQYGGNYIGFYSDSQAAGENPFAHNTTDFMAGAYGDGPEYGYGYDSQEHTFSQVESSQFIAESQGSYTNSHIYSYKVGNPGNSPFWWVYPDGTNYSRSGYNNIASVSVGGCSLSTGLNDCTLVDSSAGFGPPSNESINIKICANGLVYDTFDWTQDGSTPTCTSQHMLPTESGTIVTDDMYMNWGAQTGHTIGATASIPITVTYGTQLGASGGSYLASAALPTSAPPTLTASPTGADTWGYEIVQYWNGISAGHSTQATVNGAATLDSGDTVSIQVSNFQYGGAAVCYVYRTASGGTPSTLGLIAGPVDCQSTVIDNGLAGDSSSPPNTNLTGHTILNDGYLVTPASNFFFPQISGSGCIGISGGVVSTTASGCSAGTTAWDSLTNPAAGLTLSMSGYKSTFNYNSSASEWLWDNTTASTSGANRNTPEIDLYGTVWNGAASIADGWSFQGVMGTGSNPTSTLTLAHTGSSGAASLGVPSLIDGSSTQYGVAYGGGSSSPLNYTAAGTSGVPLVGNGSSAPHFAALNLAGGSGVVTGQLAAANTPLTTSQDLFYLNGSSLARLPISTVSVGNCLGNNSGTWGDFTCSGGSGSGININVNGGSNLGGPANFQNGTSGNNINFSNPSGSIVQAVVQSASIMSAMLASGLTLGGTTTATISGNSSTATALASYTNYSVYGSGSSTGAWITPTGNSQCLMSDPSTYASVTPSFQSCLAGSLFASYKFGSNTAITSGGNYFQLVPGVGLSSSTYTGSGTSGAPYIATINLSNPSASVLGGVKSLTCSTSGWLNAISTGGLPNCLQPASTDLSDYGSIPNAALLNDGVTINGTTVALGASGNISFNVNGSPLSSLVGFNAINSTVNAVGLSATISNPATNQFKVEITGASYSGTAAKATALASTPTQCSVNPYATGIAASGNANCIGVVNTTATYAGGTVSANTCVVQTAVTMTGLKTSAGIHFTNTSNPSAINGWGAVGGMVWNAWPTANTVNWEVCNQTASPIMAGGITWNVDATQQ